MARTFKVIRLCGLLLGSCTVLHATHASAQQNDRCLDMRSQNEMNICEAEQYQTADTDLNQTYRTLLSKYKSDTQFVEKLRLAQEAWLNFRDAYLDSIYYQKDKLQAYGSVYPTCKAILLTRLTIERTTGIEAGCSIQRRAKCAVSRHQRMHLPINRQSPEVPVVALPRRVGPAFDLASTTNEVGARSSRSVRGWIRCRMERGF
jgi:uncharacterized protein YecT (DUF1311 family)